MKTKMRHPSAGIHKCGYADCQTVVTSSRFLCLHHWKILPAELKADLSRAFRNYLQGRTRVDLVELRKVQGECIRHLLEWDHAQAP